MSFKLGSSLNINKWMEVTENALKMRNLGHLRVKADMLHGVSGFSAGLDVGHKFVSRAEMVSIGLHHHWLKGIDYLDNVTDIVSGGFDFKLPRVSLNNHVVDVLKA